MPRWLKAPDANMIEPVPIADTYVDMIGAIERVDGILRIYYCAEQMIVGCPAHRQAIVTAKLLWPLSRIGPARAKFTAAVNIDIMGITQIARLVKN